MSTAKRILKVGFDLDGVLLYNPARIFRPVTIAIKKILPHKSPSQITNFYYPHSAWEQIIWRIVHWSSLFVAPGFDDLKQLALERKVEAYIVTSRYDCLRADFEHWVKKLNSDNIFVEAYHNKLNIQPHEFKIQKINELKLDVFVEDNWNIVEAIQNKTKARPLWITNMLDHAINYPYKFNNLHEAIQYMRTHLVAK